MLAFMDIFLEIRYKFSLITRPYYFAVILLGVISLYPQLIYEKSFCSSVGGSCTACLYHADFSVNVWTAEQ